MLVDCKIAGIHIDAMRGLVRISVPVLSVAMLLAGTPSAQAAGEGSGVVNRSAGSSADGTLEADPLSGPDSPSKLLQVDRGGKADLEKPDVLQDWNEWKSDLAQESGFSFGADYTSVGFIATSSLGDDTAASGIARIFGSWKLVNRGEQNTGSLEFKVEHRHSYTDVPPVAFGFEVGYAGTPEPVFSDQGFRTTTLYWKQRFLEDRVVANLGFIDVKEYFDVYSLASPWTGFHNLAFSTGSNTMAVLPDGALGALVGAYLPNNVYVAASIADASADPTQVFDGFNTFFNDFDTFKTFEIGVTGGGRGDPGFFLQKVHIAFWQLDDSKETGAPGGWGINGSLSHAIDEQLLFFLRGAWAHEGGGVYEASVSTGFGYLNEPGGNLLGVGLNWGRPNSDTFGMKLGDQWTSEIFYRIQPATNVQVTPSVQLLVNPALNPDKDFLALFGLRGRITF